MKTNDKPRGDLLTRLQYRLLLEGVSSDDGTQRTVTLEVLKDFHYVSNERQQAVYLLPGRTDQFLPLGRFTLTERFLHEVRARAKERYDLTLQV